MCWICGAQLCVFVVLLTSASMRSRARQLVAHNTRLAPLFITHDVLLMTTLIA